MNRSILRVLAWTLLLGSAAGAIFAGITMGGQELFSWPLVLTHRPGPMANWSLFFLSLAIGLCVYLLRGMETGKWSLTVSGILVVSGVAAILLVLGVAGLLLLGVVSVFAAPILLRRKSTRNDI